jgi:uncharacterized protein
MPASTRSPRQRAGAVVLFHGAGSDRDHSSLVLLEERLAPLAVERVNFPYRNKPGRRPPDREPVLVAAVAEAIAECASRHRVATSRIVVGGRSMGGRMCSLAVARGVPAAGLVLISYPLHPPGKPEKLRTDHLPSIGVPTLVIQGTRDPFGTPDEVERHLRAIASPVTFEWVDGGRHDLKGADEQIVASVASWLATLR